MEKDEIMRGELQKVADFRALLEERERLFDACVEANGKLLDLQEAGACTEEIALAEAAVAKADDALGCVCNAVNGNPLCNILGSYLRQVVKTEEILRAGAAKTEEEAAGLAKETV